MSAIPPSAAKRTAEIQAQLFEQAVRSHRSDVQAMLNSRGGMCMASGWDVSIETLNDDFALDDVLLQQLIQGSSAPPRAPQPSGPSAMQRYLFPPPAGAPLLSPQRLGEEVPGAVYGPGNALANSSAALAGALRGLGERSGAQLLADGARAIAAGEKQIVKLGPHIELYNAAARRQNPRVRLRVRGAPVTIVRSTIPASGGPVTQWRVNSAGNSASLKVQGMTAQQMRNTAIMAGEQRLPSALRWASGRAGGGILTFAPSLALDAYSAIETDLQTQQSRFNTHKFLVDSARSQSGNAIGLLGGIGVVAVAGIFVAGAPLVLIGLAGGVAFQVLWNWSGMADESAGLAERALR